MTQQSLGRLEKVDLRTVWSGEATEFTPWLAEKNNLDLLGDSLDMDLELESREKGVGSYSADIVCKNMADGSRIVIENQLERTDHSHLGQILTYAAGLGAGTVVWIARSFTDEHRAAIDWLNEVSTESAQFFGLEVEVWRIGDSQHAPKFNVVAKPNEWTRSEKTRAQGLSPDRQMQLDFWLGFRDYISANDLFIKPGNPKPLSYMDFSLRRSGFWLAAIASLYDSDSGNYGRQELRAELCTNHSYAEYFYDQLVAQKPQIQNEMASEVTWYNPGKGVRVRKIYVKMPTSLKDAKLRPEQYAWLIQNLEKLRKIYEKHLQDLNIPPENYQKENTVT